jgi:cytochrome c oxidase subunit 3
MKRPRHAEGGAASPAQAHPRFLAHHFDTPEQQYQSGKLGMWMFLATEILLFGGLFCAYSIYRAHHPEIFVYGHQFLDKKLGAVNTLVLIASSFTMAWAVRCAQLGDKRKLVALLTITLICGGVFLSIKKVEYEQKWKHGLLWGKRYHPTVHVEGHGGAMPGGETEAGHEAGAAAGPQGAAESGAAAQEPAPRVSDTTDLERAGLREKVEPSKIPPAATGPAGLTSGAKAPPAEPEPHNVQIFFSIYFAMTGLHGLHVIAGMIAIGWVLFRSTRGEFGPEYFTPVDLVGLYWHLVDLIWIYLFPLLYLIK